MAKKSTSASASKEQEQQPQEPEQLSDSEREIIKLLLTNVSAKLRANTSQNLLDKDNPKKKQAVAALQNELVTKQKLSLSFKDKVNNALKFHGLQ